MCVKGNIALECVKIHLAQWCSIFFFLVNVKVWYERGRFTVYIKCLQLISTAQNRFWFKGILCY